MQAVEKALGRAAQTSLREGAEGPVTPQQFRHFAEHVNENETLSDLI